MNLVAGAQQIASRVGSAIGYTVRGSMHSNARTQFSNQVFLGRPLDNLTDCEVFPIRMLSMKKRRCNEDFIGDFDFRHYSSYRLNGRGRSQTRRGNHDPPRCPAGPSPRFHPGGTEIR